MLGDSLRRRHGPGQDPPPKDLPRKGRSDPRRPARRGSRWHFHWWQWTLAALVMLGGSFLVGYLLSTLVLFPRPDTAGTAVAVPSLYGERQTRAESTLRDAGLEVGQVTEMASLEADRGRVLAQDPIPGQRLNQGAAVSFAISGGPPELRVPPVTGMHVASARELLESVGFSVDIRQVESSSAREGTVTRSDPSEGVARPLPAAVTLLVGAGPPPDTTSGVRPIGDGIPQAGPPGPSGGGAPR